MRFRRGRPDLAGELESLLGGDHGDDLIDDGGSGDRALHDGREVRPRPLQNAADNSCEDERDAGVREQCETEIILYYRI